MRYHNNRSPIRRAGILLGGILGGSFLLAGCASSQPTAGGNAEATTQPAVSRPSDTSVSAWVRDALELDPRVTSEDIRIDTVDGVVTLSGTASNLLEKRYARLEADKIDGVTGVIDEIVVAPAVRSDAEIKHDVETRLAHSPHGHLRDLTVSVAEGAVTLRGNLPSWSLCDEAEMLASEVRGVRSVTRDLSVDMEHDRPDLEKRDAIVAALDRDVYLVGMPITVTVEGGHATLEGTVGNAYEKQRAERDVRLASQIDHIDDNLYVDWFEERGVREGATHPDDEQLRESVRAALDADFRLADASAIKVEVLDGRVTLRGSVPYYLDKRIVEDDARDVVGVREVTDLVSSTDERRDDQAIAGGVTIELGVDYALNGNDIGVRVNDGEVTLTGQVDSYFQKRHAEEVASRVAGVRGVINEITVTSDPGFTDEAIRERISKHLAWNWKTRSVADAIHVKVEDGSVVLSGMVDSWSERMEAERLARLTEGVEDVTDDLEVAYR